VPFVPLTRPAKLNAVLWGPSGAGKTYTALALAQRLGGPVAVVDTEHGASAFYTARFPADVLILDPPFAPERWLDALREAEAGGYHVLVLDSLSPEWAGPGGCLDLVAALRRQGRKPHDAWAVVTPRHDALLDALNRTPLSVLVTWGEKPGCPSPAAPRRRSPSLGNGSNTSSTWWPAWTQAPGADPEVAPAAACPRRPIPGLPSDGSRGGSCASTGRTRPPKTSLCRPAPTRAPITPRSRTGLAPGC
jgi:DNA polymerase III delta prime subunit